MPIKDLSDNVRLPRLGKIHLGYKHPEKGYPVKTDYFVFPKEHSDYGELVRVFGEKPKELRILIPVEDEELWASQYYKSYSRTYGLVCKGDGENAMRMISTKTGDLPDKEATPVELREYSCAGKDCPDYKAKKCQEVMNLRFILPEIPGLGIWQIDTGSINSILNINSCAKIIKKAFGRISLVPLKLTLEPIEVNNPETGKKQTVYVLNLRTNVTMAQLADVAREQAKTFMLEAPDLEAVYEEQVKSDIALWGDGTPATSTPTPAARKSEHDIAKPMTDEEVKGMWGGEKPEPSPEVPSQPEKPERDPATIKNFGDLYKACLEDFGLKARQTVWKELNVNDQSQISETPEACYRRIATARR